MHHLAAEGSNIAQLPVLPADRNSTSPGWDDSRRWRHCSIAVSRPECESRAHGFRNRSDMDSAVFVLLRSAGPEGRHVPTLVSAADDPGSCTSCGSSSLRIAERIG